jgi:hypothetical protein
MVWLSKINIFQGGVGFYQYDNTYKVDLTSTQQLAGVILKAGEQDISLFVFVVRCLAAIRPGFQRTSSGCGWCSYRVAGKTHIMTAEKTPKKNWRKTIMQSIRASFIVGFAILFSFSHVCLSQWVQTNGPEGCSITSLLINGNNMFVGVDQNGIFHSADSGKSWRLVYSTIASRASVSAFAVVGSNVFAGTNVAGVLRSSDGGATWVAPTSGSFPSVSVRSLAVIGTTLFAGTWRGMYRSGDSGESWVLADSSMIKRSINSLAVSGTMLFAGTPYDGVFCSTNNGATWTAVNTGLPKKEILALTVYGTMLYAGTKNGGVFRSTDNGTSWKPVSAGMLADSTVNALAAGSIGLVAGTSTKGMYFSADSGSTWAPVNTGLALNAAIDCCAIDGNTIYTGTNSAGVFVSTNNATSWTAINAGLPINSTPFALAVIGPDLFAGTTHGGVFRSSDNGATWVAVNSGLTNHDIWSLAASATTLFAGTGGGGVFRSTDTGKSWIGVNAGLTVPTTRALLITKNAVFAGTTGGGIFRSSDNGLSWTALYSDSSIAGKYIISLAGGTNTTGETYLYSGTETGVVYSANSGTTWNPINSGLLHLYAFSLLRTSTDLFAGTDNGVYLFGPAWTRISSGIPDSTTVYSLVLSGTTLIAGTGAGVYTSSNNGQTWSVANTGLKPTRVASLVVCGANLFAGTDWGGVWRRPLIELTNKSESVLPPAEHSHAAARLSVANHHVVRIKVSIPCSESVSIRVFTLSGKEMVPLVNRELSSGSHWYYWDTQSLTNGCYLVRIEAGAEVFVQSIPVMR